MERTVSFRAQNKNLYGILHVPESLERVAIAVLMVVGGFQTRVGSHRLYIQLARYLADRGISSLRFDYEGIGDSEGSFVGFEGAGPSIKAAIDFLYGEFPDLQSLIIWSLCDGAAASAIYAPSDVKRISALILANPFVETEEGHAQTVIKHYYKNRFFEREFWLKLVKFKFDVKKSIESFIDLTIKAGAHNTGDVKQSEFCEPLPIRVMNGLRDYNRPIHLLISTKDLTGMEFFDHYKNNPELAKLEKQGLIKIHHISDSDHTFSNSKVKLGVFDNIYKIIEMIATTLKYDTIQAK